MLETATNLFDGELGPAILRHENPADVLANRTNAHQLDAANEQDRHDQRWVPGGLAAENQRLENVVERQQERGHRDHAADDHGHPEWYHRKRDSSRSRASVN